MHTIAMDKAKRMTFGELEDIARRDSEKVVAYIDALELEIKLEQFKKLAEELGIRIEENKRHESKKEATEKTPVRGHAQSEITD